MEGLEDEKGTRDGLDFVQDDFSYHVVRHRLVDAYGSALDGFGLSLDGEFLLQIVFEKDVFQFVIQKLPFKSVGPGRNALCKADLVG